jgi:hypothetical protein
MIRLVYSMKIAGSYGPPDACSVADAAATAPSKRDASTTTP